jgi:hypothetical protein
MDDFSKKKKLVRPQNLEEKYPLVCNLFYIFFFHYVCRREPVTNDKIPFCQNDDKTYYSFIVLKNSWRKAYLKYLKDIEIYEDSKMIYSEIKPPKKPNLILITFKALVSWKLIFGFFCCIFGFFYLFVFKTFYLELVFHFYSLY